MDNQLDVISNMNSAQAANLLVKLMLPRIVKYLNSQNHGFFYHHLGSYNRALGLNRELNKFFEDPKNMKLARLIQQTPYYNPSDKYYPLAKKLSNVVV